jgi:hypothetical protein
MPFDLSMYLLKVFCVFQVNGVGKTAVTVEYPERPGQPLCEVNKPILKLFLIDILGPNVLYFVVMWWKLWLRMFLLFSVLCKEWHL